MKPKRWPIPGGGWKSREIGVGIAWGEDQRNANRRGKVEDIGRECVSEVMHFIVDRNLFFYLLKGVYALCLPAVLRCYAWVKGRN